jgi:hypothetical protein
MTKYNDEFKLKISTTTKKLWDTEEYRRSHIEGMRKKASEPKIKEMRSQLSKDLWKNPEYRAKVVSRILEVKQSKEFKQKMQGYWSSDEFRNPRSGENSCMWKGGTSFGPYCPKFNYEFKERVREFFGRRCVVCGKTESENGKRLDVHHIDYNKQTCCDNTKPLFVALCKSCHRRTNKLKEYWEETLKNLILLEYDGECFLPRGSIIIKPRKWNGAVNV